MTDVLDGPDKSFHASGKQPGRRMHVRTSCDMYSDRHVLGLLLCAGVIALCCAVLCCARGIAVDPQREHRRTAYNEKRNNGKKTKKRTSREQT